jgi:hypothetical protein
MENLCDTARQCAQADAFPKKKKLKKERGLAVAGVGVGLHLKTQTRGKQNGNKTFEVWRRWEASPL